MPFTAITNGADDSRRNTRRLALVGRAGKSLAMTQDKTFPATWRSSPAEPRDRCCNRQALAHAGAHGILSRTASALELSRSNQRRRGARRSPARLTDGLVASWRAAVAEPGGDRCAVLNAAMLGSLTPSSIDAKEYGASSAQPARQQAMIADFDRHALGKSGIVALSSRRKRTAGGLGELRPSRRRWSNARAYAGRKQHSGRTACISHTGATRPGSPAGLPGEEPSTLSRPKWSPRNSPTLQSDCYREKMLVGA